MKIYLSTFLMLLSFSGFGQDSITNDCHLRFCTPEGTLAYSFHFYNHFQDFFPSKKMTGLGIKTIKIVDENTNNYKILYHYRLDENGFVNNCDVMNSDFDYQFFYERDNERILRRGYLIYKRDTPWTHFSYTSSSMMIHHNDIGHHVLRPSEYIFDDKNRVIKFISHTSKDTTNYVYDEANYTFTNIETTRRDTTISKVFFNKNWHPIKEQFYENLLKIFEGNYTYENNQLVKHEFYKLELKPINWGDNFENIPDFNDPDNYEKDSHQTVFHYNSTGLLEKIIQTTDQGTCKYRVYYYTE